MTSRFLGYFNLGLMLGFCLIVAGMAIEDAIACGSIEQDNSIVQPY
ncbi:MAG: hypothetical protein ACRCYP_03675 [Alphaproteobacteria bacterium]